MASFNPSPPIHGAGFTDPSELLICGFCEEPYDDDTHQAMFLSCHHTFCSQCITDLSLVQHNPGIIRCPRCQQHTQIQQLGIAVLLQNLHIDSNKKEIPTHTGPRKRESCHKHSDQPKSFFCETCEEAICRDCTVLGHKGADGHVIKELSDAEVFHRQALSQQMNDWRISLTQIQGNIEKLQQEMTRLTAAKKLNRNDIEIIIQHVHKKVEERKQELLEINEIAFDDAQSSVLSLLKPQKDATDAINKNLNLSEKVVRYGTLHQVIHTNQKLISTAEQMQPNFPEYRRQCIKFDMTKGKKAVEESLHHLGEIHFKELTDDAGKFTR